MHLAPKPPASTQGVELLPWNLTVKETAITLLFITSKLTSPATYIWIECWCSSLINKRSSSMNMIKNYWVALDNTGNWEILRFSCTTSISLDNSRYYTLQPCPIIWLIVRENLVQTCVYNSAIYVWYYPSSLVKRNLIVDWDAFISNTTKNLQVKKKSTTDTVTTLTLTSLLVPNLTVGSQKSALRLSISTLTYVIYLRIP